MDADLESHIVMDTASQGNEKRMTKANPVWDKRTKEAGTEQEEMVLTQVVFYFRNQRPTRITVKQIKSTSHAWGHQTRHLIPLELNIVLQKFSEADREHDLAPRREPPDKGNSETFQEEYRKYGRRKHRTGDSSNFHNGRQVVQIHVNSAGGTNTVTQTGRVTAVLQGSLAATHTEICALWTWSGRRWR